MKKAKKHIGSVVLMASSIFLLLVFQYFWLKQVYEDEKRNLIKETNVIFIEVMSALQDSLIRKSIKSSNPADSAMNLSHYSFNRFPAFFPPAMLFKRDSIRKTEKNGKITLQRGENALIENKVSITFSKDSAWDKGEDKSKNMKIVMPQGKWAKDSVKVMANSEIQVLIASDKPQDSVNLILKSLIKNKAQLPMQAQSFVIQLTGDTISETAIRQKFKKQLDTASIYLNFELKKTQDRIQVRENFLFGKEVAQPENGIITAPFFCMPPSPIYQAYFNDYQYFILKKMTSPFIFSFILLLFTSAAFFLIYSNLQKQERLIALKNDFISNVTHELKTPVTTVGVAIEALQNFNALQNPELTKEYLEISKNELNRLAILVDKIMKMASFESKGIELKLTQIDMQKLVDQILKSMKLQFEKQRAMVEFQVVDKDGRVVVNGERSTAPTDNGGGENTNNGEEFFLFADEVHLTNVIYNLLDNALKYSTESPKIEITLQNFSNTISFSVKDDGVGIPKEYQGKIFDKFFRVPTGNLHNIKGYGLGLSYVHSVVQLHGGSIEVESGTGKGSKFVVSLPKKKVGKKNTNI